MNESEDNMNDGDFKNCDTCTICMSKFEEGEGIKTLKCFHRYHS